MLPKVTLVGRPNVGKSSIFNHLSGRRIAIVSDKENTTRDVLEHRIDDREYEMSYILADSGGLVEADKETLLADVHARTDEAIASSDCILFVVEYNKMTDWEDQIVKRLRRSKKPVIVVANKADNSARALEAYEHLNTGLGEVVPVSAEHHRGFGELRSVLASLLKKQGFSFQDASALE